MNAIEKNTKFRVVKSRVKEGPPVRVVRTVKRQLPAKISYKKMTLEERIQNWLDAMPSDFDDRYLYRDRTTVTHPLPRFAHLEG